MMDKLESCIRPIIEKCLRDSGAIHEYKTDDTIKAIKHEIEQMNRTWLCECGHRNGEHATIIAPPFAGKCDECECGCYQEVPNELNGYKRLVEAYEIRLETEKSLNRATNRALDGIVACLGFYANENNYTDEGVLLNGGVTPNTPDGPCEVWEEPDFGKYAKRILECFIEKEPNL